jgi:hypothetical protein
MSPVEKLSNPPFAATCIREIIDDDGTQSQSQLNALARIHLGITVLMQRIKAGRRPARRSGRSLI